MQNIFAQTRQHPHLTAGLVVVALVVALGPVGSLFIDRDMTRVGSATAVAGPTAIGPPICTFVVTAAVVGAICIVVCTGTCGMNLERCCDM